MNWTVIAIVGAAVLALIVYLVIANRKDEKEVEKSFNREASEFEEDTTEANDTN